MYFIKGNWRRLKAHMTIFLSTAVKWHSKKARENQCVALRIFSGLTRGEKTIFSTKWNLINSDYKALYIIVKKSLVFQEQQVTYTHKAIIFPIKKTFLWLCHNTRGQVSKTSSVELYPGTGKNGKEWFKILVSLVSVVTQPRPLLLGRWMDWTSNPTA